MKLVIRDNECTFWREPHEWGIKNENDLMLALKCELNRRGYDLIKKLMCQDGHMVSDTQYYLRARKKRTRGGIVFIYDDQYAVRNAAQDYTHWQRVTFRVEREA